MLLYIEDEYDNDYNFTAIITTTRVIIIIAIIFIIITTLNYVYLFISDIPNES